MCHALLVESMLRREHVSTTRQQLFSLACPHVRYRVLPIQQAWRSPDSGLESRSRPTATSGSQRFAELCCCAFLSCCPLSAREATGCNAQTMSHSLHRVQAKSYSLLSCERHHCHKVTMCCTAMQHRDMYNRACWHNGGLYQWKDYSKAEGRLCVGSR